MFSSAIDGALTSARIGNFFYTNGKALQSSYVKLASGKTISEPSHGVGDYFRSEEYTIQNKRYDGVSRALNEASGVVDFAERSNQMIWDDLNEMKGMIQGYYAAGASDDEKSVIALQFEELKIRIQATQDNAQWDGKEVLSDSSTDPLVSINTNPHDIDQRFQISFDADKIVDVSGLDITAGETVITDALNDQVDRTASYAAQLTGYRYGLNAQKKMAETTIEGNDDRLRTILDVDEAEELFSLTKRSIQQQAATSMFAQSQLSQGSMIALVASL